MISFYYLPKNEIEFKGYNFTYHNKSSLSLSWNSLYDNFLFNLEYFLESFSTVILRIGSALLPIETFSIAWIVSWQQPSGEVRCSSPCNKMTATCLWCCYRKTTKYPNYLYDWVNCLQFCYNTIYYGSIKPGFDS